MALARAKICIYIYYFRDSGHRSDITILITNNLEQNFPQKYVLVFNMRHIKHMSK